MRKQINLAKISVFADRLDRKNVGAGLARIAPCMRPNHQGGHTSQHQPSTRWESESWRELPRSRGSYCLSGMGCPLDSATGSDLTLRLTARPGTSRSLALGT